MTFSEGVMFSILLVGSFLLKEPRWVRRALDRKLPAKVYA